jgi:hypothetical protein
MQCFFRALTFLALANIGAWKNTWLNSNTRSPAAKGVFGD